MKTFKIEVKEILSRIIEVKAENEEEALNHIQEQYQEEEIVLDSNDFIDTEFNIID